MNTPKYRPLLFIDFDDVICLNRSFGGYDAILAISEVERGRKMHDFDQLWTQLFDQEATDFLWKIHAEFEPIYVLSTSWRVFFSRDAFVSILVSSGLDFVAQNLHKSFKTPELGSQALRSNEIKTWLCTNEAGHDAWVVLDDERSGTGYVLGACPPYVVMCRKGVGLTEVEYQKLRLAFELQRPRYLR